ncbi:MAG: hypothetical protein P1U56_12455 [Saprospiraceae bacterium]|nr:hypothetical protein [Saprospiraceae bacterium]
MAKIIVLGALFTFIALIVLFAIGYYRKSTKAVRDTQSIVTDKEIIEFLDSQPDKIMDSKILMAEFGLSKFEAGSRLNHLMTHGVFKALSTKGGLVRYYTLVKPIENSYDLELTDDAFMTVEDLLLIFKHNDYQVSLQELCLSTGLPVKVLLEEMKYFESEKVVKCLYKSSNGGMTHQKIYTLCEPYRSNPDQFMELKDVNFELEDIFNKVKKNS